MNSNNKKIKWKEEWKTQIKDYAGQEIAVNKTFKKGDTKPDGTIATQDETIKVKVNDFENLFQEINTKTQQAKDKLLEIQKQSGNDQELIGIYETYEALDLKLNKGSDGHGQDSWKSEKTNDVQRTKNFYTDSYQGQGWTKLHQEYLEKSWKDKNGQDQSYSNLYEGAISQENNTWLYYRITESEFLKLITRIIKELGKIKLTEFNNFIDEPTTDLKLDSHYDSAIFTKANIKKWAKSIQERSQFLVDNLIKTEDHPEKGKPANGKRVEYSFGQDFTQFGTANSVDTSGTVFDEKEVEMLFNLADIITHRIYDWKDQDKFKTAVAEIKADTLIGLPAEKEPVSESKLKDWGITGYKKDSSGKTNYYLTDYGTQISSWDNLEKSEWNWDSQFEIKVVQGIEGWTRLLFDLQSNQPRDKSHQLRLASSFTNDPISQLLQATRSMDEFERFGASKEYTLHDFPLQLAREKKRWERLKISQEALLKKASQNQEEITKLDEEYQTLIQAVKDQKKAVETKIKTRLGEFRKELEEKWKVSPTLYKGFAKTATEDNRISQLDIVIIQSLLEKIRFLEHFDEKILSSEANENQAWTDLENLSTKIHTPDLHSKIYCYQRFLALRSSDLEKSLTEFAEKGQEGGWVIWTLQDLEEGFKELEELIKPQAWWTEVRAALKKRLEKQEENEKPEDWQNETALGSDFTAGIVEKWKKTAKFKTIDEVKKLLQKVREENKTDFKADFLKWVKDKGWVSGDNTTEKGIENWKELVKKGPKEVITAIEFYQYEQLDNSSKLEKEKQLKWTLQKETSESITETEIKSVLYELAEGQKTLATTEYKRQQEPEPNGPSSNENNGDEEMSFAKTWFGFGHLGKSLLAYEGLLMIIGGIVAAIFWKKLREWWSGPEEEGKEQVDIYDGLDKDEDDE